mmetsp:Transcript_17566/g.26281  ORF Transcript_17566/g.26281 Transcript_17566/m.26281 type:complete len:428 (+) Transcript_17566:592-1875(+)
MMTSNEKPWILLKLAKELDSFLFQLNLTTLYGAPWIVVAEPKVVRQVLIDPLSKKTPQIYETLANGVCNGTQSIFTSNGEFWHSRRSGMVTAFSTKHVKRMTTVASRKEDKWIEKRLLKFIEKGEAFDVFKEMVNIVSEAMIETAFEYQIDDAEKEKVLHDFNVALKEFTSKAVANPFRKIFGIFLPERRLAHISSKRIHLFSMKLIEHYRRLESPTKDTIIDKIMNNDAYKNDIERAADIIVLIIASFETTANTIAWILKDLAKCKKYQEELRESLSSLNRDGWGQSHVLRKIVKESMRLHPVVAGGPKRTIGKDIVIDGGAILQKGTIVDMPLILLLRNSNIFEDADSFIPSRWDNPTQEMKEAFIPFALGKQNCIGQSLANTEIYSLVPRICSEFELELVDEGETSFFLTLKSENTMIKAKKIS